MSALPDMSALALGHRAYTSGNALIHVLQILLVYSSKEHNKAPMTDTIVNQQEMRQNASLVISAWSTSKDANRQVAVGQQQPKYSLMIEVLKDLKRLLQLPSELSTIYGFAPGFA